MPAPPFVQHPLSGDLAKMGRIMRARTLAGLTLRRWTERRNDPEEPFRRRQSLDLAKVNCAGFRM